MQLKNVTILEMVVCLGVLGFGPVLAIFLYSEPSIAMGYPILTTLAGVLSLGFFMVIGLWLHSFFRRY